MLMTRHFDGVRLLNLRLLVLFQILPLLRSNHPLTCIMYSLISETEREVFSALKLYVCLYAKIITCICLKTLRVSLQLP